MVSSESCIAILADRGRLRPALPPQIPRRAWGLTSCQDGGNINLSTTRSPTTGREPRKGRATRRAGRPQSKNTFGCAAGESGASGSAVPSSGVRRKRARSGRSYDEGFRVRMVRAVADGKAVRRGRTPRDRTRGADGLEGLSALFVNCGALPRLTALPVSRLYSLRTHGDADNSSERSASWRGQDAAELARSAVRSERGDHSARYGAPSP